MQDDVLLCLVPERRGIGVKAGEQARERIMGSPARSLWLDACRFSAGEDERGSNQEIDVVQVRHFGLVHARTIPQNAPTA